MVAVGGSDAAGVAALVVSAGYGEQEPVAVGVSGLAGGPLVVAQGRTRGGARIAADTLTYAASLSKQITAACVALLVNGGLVAVDEPLARWLPGLPAWAGQVRLRHLIHHCGGLPSEEELRSAMSPAHLRWDSPSVLQALAAAVEVPVDPGVAFAYRNAGYVCLAAVVERACGFRFEDFARRRVFEPLGMTRTCYWSGPDPHPSGAEPFAPVDQPVPLSLGDGGVWTTLQDLMRWNDAFLRDELGVAELMSALGRLDDGTVLHYAWGFGIAMRRGQPVHSAGGNVPGMTGTLRRLPHSGRGIAVLTQTDGIKRILRLTDDLVDRFW